MTEFIRYPWEDWNGIERKAWDKIYTRRRMLRSKVKGIIRFKVWGRVSTRIIDRIEEKIENIITEHLSRE